MTITKHRFGCGCGDPACRKCNFPSNENKTSTTSRVPDEFLEAAEAVLREEVPHHWFNRPDEAYPPYSDLLYIVLEHTQQMTKTYPDRGRKYETPRNETPCQYGVMANCGYQGAPVVVDCGKPAVAEWTWGDNKYEPMPLCEAHDRKAADDTDPNESWVTRTEL